MSRGAKIAIALTVSVIALNGALSLIHSLLGGTPGGPPSSSYATGPAGVGAYASLLVHAGHRVERAAGRPSGTHFDPDATVVLLDPATAVSGADADALERFVVSGGRLLVGGASGSWLGRIVPGAPTWSPLDAGSVHPLAPIGAIASLDRVETPGSGSWEGGSALPLLGTRARTVLALAAVGSGQVWLLANTAPLQNRLLAHDDDAALGLALAGASSRPVVFLEGYHGYGASTGLAAVPSRWWLGFGLLFAAALTLMLASGRRLGPPQTPERALAPPRREYVEALAGIIARSRQRDEAIGPVRAHARRLVAERAGLARSAPDGELRAAARLLGIPEPDAEALTRPVRSDADVLALGRTLVRLARESQR